MLDSRASFLLPLVIRDPRGPQSQECFWQGFIEHVAEVNDGTLLVEGPHQRQGEGGHITSFHLS